MLLDLAVVLVILLAGNMLGAVLVLVWAYWSRTPLAALGFVRERHWIRIGVLAALAGAALKVVLKAFVLPALGFEPVNAAYRYLTGNAAAVWRMMPAIVLGAGIGEEVIWRGFLFERLRRVFSNDQFGNVVIVLISSAVFGLAHYADQGTAGVVQGVITGLAFGAMYAWRKSLLAPILMHTALDVTALVMIYLNIFQ